MTLLGQEIPLRGGFAAYIAKKGDFEFETMKAAVIVGSALASYTVEKFGTERLVELSEEDIVHRIGEFRNLTAFEVMVD